MLARPRGSPGPGRSRRGPGAALPLRHDLARSALVPAGTRRGRRAGVGDDRLRRARPPRPLRACRHRALVRRLDRRRTEAGDRPAARATERPGATRGSRCDPRPGRRAAGRDDRRHPLEPRLLCARSRKSRPRRAFYATRLYRDLRERRGLVYHVGSSLQMTKTRGMIELEYACDPQNVARARAIIERDLRDMRTTPVRPEELLQARRLLLSNIPLGESSEEDIAKGLLTRSAEDLPLDEPLRAAERYLRLDAHDIEAAFRRWVRPESLAEVVLGPHT